MIHIKKISIAFFMSNIMICQAMEYYEAPQKESHVTPINEMQPQNLQNNPPAAIKAESQQRKPIPTNIQKTSTQNTDRTKPTKDQSQSSTPAIKSDKQYQKNEINFNEKPKSSTKTTTDTAKLDSSASEGITDITSKIYAATIEYTTSPEQTNSTDPENSSNLTDGLIDTLSHVLTSSLERVLSEISRSHKKIQSKSAIESLRKEIQYLSEQIQKYNSINIYNDVDLMIEFIESMNTYIKICQLVALTSTNIKNINTAYSTAVTTSNIFKKQNIILNQQLVPNEVIQMFTQPIDDSQNLIEIKDATSMIHTIYDKNGSMDIIFNSWQSFMASTYSSIKNDLYYGAFITFLLIFQDTVSATTSILNETSDEFQVTNPLQMKSLSYSAPK